MGDGRISTTIAVAGNGIGDDNMKAEKAKKYKEYFEKKRERYLQKVLYAKDSADIEDSKEKARMYNEIVWLLEK